MPAHPAPTLEDVAARAGVSRATASRVVNGDPRVREAARVAVNAAVTELSYRPNRAARRLVTRAADSIAVVVPESDERVFSDPFFSGTLRGVTRALGSLPMQVVLVMGNPDDGDHRMERYLRGGHTDGAIVVSHHQNDNLWRVLAETQLPSVFLGRPYAAEARAPYVDVDNAAGAALAARHLIERGCRRVGTVTGPLDMSAGQDRLRGWQETLEAAGLETDLVEHGDFTAAGGAEATQRLLERCPDLDGLFAASDQMAVAAIGELGVAGRRVPDDVAVVGYDDSAAATMSRPALTTVVNPISEMASRAVDLLLRVMDGEVVEPAILPTGLVVRESA
ncbi:LacI family DNA-binding transcriptional regulator [Ornithinimicrobium faecis]|uniref:LacI family transcriptional regulator n=1 Tax=Ornithinimicrobium faecis TaxID=2934158 RepID=A0ABY4YY69_9MICO|nr:MULTISPECIES: LacI family DNA-binding transcriptional regulator [unclassified Ornithinimicrobium]USQ81718.1 LacI family transcriptional regulator [Ornithinimicrobium sp. HY1793]